MKTIRRSLLRDEVSYEAYSGESAYGPVYADAVDVLGKVSMIRQLVRNSNGEEVVSEMTIYLHPDDATELVAESRITAGGYSTTVLAVSPQGRPGETVEVKVTCA